MPRSFGERLLAALGLAVVLVLVGVTLMRGGGGDGGPAGGPPPPVEPAPQPPPVTTTTTTTESAPPPPPPIAPPAGSAVLVLKATRGPTLVSVRVESEEGASLHEGIVERGETITVSSDRLWIRLGSASNVDMTLNGRPVERLRAGMIDLIASADSIQAVS